MEIEDATGQATPALISLQLFFISDSVVADWLSELPADNEARQFRTIVPLRRRRSQNEALRERRRTGDQISGKP